MAALSDLEKALIIGFCVTGGAILLFLCFFITICTLRSRCGTEKKQEADSDVESPRVGSKPPPLAAVPAPPETPSTTSENLSCISSPATSPRFPQQQQQPPHPTELMTPCPSLIFPSAHSRYAAMRVGRSAWTAAYLPPPTAYPQAHGLMEQDAGDLEQRLSAINGSERYRTRSSRGFGPILEEPSLSDPFVARAQSRWPGATPPSERGSQIRLLGATIDPASNYEDVISNPGVEGSRMWPRRSGYGPFSQSAMEAARRRTQELYNARRAQMGSPHRSPANTDHPPSPRSTTGHDLIWNRTSGRPQTGSYVIGARSDDGAESSYYRPTTAGPASLAGGEASMYLQAEEATDNNNSHAMVVDSVEATIEESNASDTPGERHLIGDAFRFLDEFDE